MGVGKAADLQISQTCGRTSFTVLMLSEGAKRRSTISYFLSIKLEFGNFDDINSRIAKADRRCVKARFFEES